MGNFQGGGNRGGGFRGGNGGGGRPNFGGNRGGDRGPVSMHKAVCDECHKSCEVPFVHQVINLFIVQIVLEVKEKIMAIAHLVEISEIVHQEENLMIDQLHLFQNQYQHQQVMIQKSN